MHPFEEPAPDQGESQQNREREGRDRQPQPHPEHVVGVTRRERDDDRQHQQRERIGNHCSAHGDADRIVLADSQLADNGVGDQRVRSEHAGQQYRSEPRKAEQVVSRDDTERHRHAEGIETESQAAQAVAFEIAHIDFQSRQEHDVEQPRRARKDDAAVAQDEVEAVGADHGSGDDEPQQRRDADLVQQQRRSENDEQDDEKLQHGIGQRKREIHCGEEYHRRFRFIQS